MILLNNPLRTCLRLQWIWFAFAVGYNVVSIWRTSQGQPPLIEGRNPTDSIISLMIIIPVFVAGAMGQLRFYALSNLVCMLLVSYVGVVVHLKTYWINDIGRYSDFYSWLLAVGINMFGVCAGIAGSVFAWRSAKNAGNT
ncbi:MAG: hypothetical protein P8O79_14825 [Halieaceae bacterium]|nr:hypothetical protein [Halieaceae bacterium]